MRGRSDSTEPKNKGKGRLYIVSAPSGVGKTSLVGRVMEHDDKAYVSVSCTTRPPRDGEKDGQSYYFVDAAAFTSMIETDQFLEHAQVFGHRYGTPRTRVEEKLTAGMDVLLEIDWQGARQVRAVYDRSISIFILPPDYQTLRERLHGRESDQNTVAQRLGDAARDLAHCSEYDYVIVNDDFEHAAGEMQSILLANRLHYGSDRERHDEFIDVLQKQIAENAGTEPS